VPYRTDKYQSQIFSSHQSDDNVYNKNADFMKADKSKERVYLEIQHRKLSLFSTK
jgi:hypothetical protein